MLNTLDMCKNSIKKMNRKRVFIRFVVYIKFVVVLAYEEALCNTYI